MIVRARYLPSLRPGSGRCRSCGCVSSRPKMTPRAAVLRTAEQSKLGSAYGKLLSHRTPSAPPNSDPGPKRLGSEWTGSARKPLRSGPMMTPTLKHMGRRRKARDWYLIRVSVLPSFLSSLSRIRNGGEGRGGGLPFIINDLGDHGPEHTDVSVQRPGEEPEEEGSR